MKIDLSQFKDTFLQESAEHVAAMESGLLALRTSPDDVEVLNGVFRAAHSIKGGAGSFGLTNLVRFTHGLENLLDRMRSLEMPATENVIALLLESVDILRLLLDAEPAEPMPNGAPELMEKLEALTAASPLFEKSGGEVAVSGQPSVAPSRPNLFRIEFRPGLDLFSSGTNPITLLRNLDDLGTVSACNLDTTHLPPLADLDCSQCYLAWSLELTTDSREEEVREVFEFVEHQCELSIVNVPEGFTPEGLTAGRAAQVGTATADQQQAIAPTSIGNAPPVVPDSPAAGKAATVKKPPSNAESNSIRVATDKVDRLIDLVGELVIAQVMTAQLVESFTPQCLPKLREAVAAMERNTRELHERIMAVRMLPVGSIFQRFTRTVYDIAQATGKQIRLQISGEDTEIDKGVLELLADPLTHLIRNSADHGIETPAVRAAAGKPEQGTVGLTAFHRSGKVVLEVSDDGAGIDCARVRKKAIERNLISPAAQLTDDQLRMLVFEPGFSTREEVSDLSGRGVGMDVVKRNVQRLNGTITLESEKGRGSTVSIELPLTLAILEGLLVRVADRILVLPLLSVVETVAPPPGGILRVAEQGEAIMVRNEPIPLLRLRRFLRLAEIPAAGETSSLVVIVEAGRKKIGLIVDDLLGQQQVVVKSLERHLGKVVGLMGATILGDGSVAPILDLAAIAEMNLFALQAPAMVPPAAFQSPPVTRSATLSH